MTPILQLSLLGTLFARWVYHSFNQEAEYIFLSAESLFGRITCFGQWDTRSHDISKSLEKWLYVFSCFLVILPPPWEEHAQPSLLVLGGGWERLGAELPQLICPRQNQPSQISLVPIACIMHIRCIDKPSWVELISSRYTGRWTVIITDCCFKPLSLFWFVT